MLVWRDGRVDAEKDSSEIGFGPITGILLETWLEGNDEGGADCRKQTSLKTWSLLGIHVKGTWMLTKIKVVLRSSLYLLIYCVSYSIVSRLYMA